MDLDGLLGIAPGDPEQQQAAEDVRACADLVQALVRRRDRGGLAPAQVAERMGVPLGVVAELESPAAGPPLSLIQRYARAVGARVAVVDG